MKRRHEAKALVDVPFRITDATAERIIAQMKSVALVSAAAGGAVAGFGVVNELKDFARSFKELLGLESDRPRSRRQQKSGAEALIQRLRYGPTGLLYYASADSRHVGFGDAVATIFKEAGWRI